MKITIDTEREAIIVVDSFFKQIDKIKKESGLAELEKELKACESAIKEQLISQMGVNDTKVVLSNYTLSKTFKEVVSYDIEAMERDHVLDKYQIKETKETLTLRKTKEK